jgi:hypothetical protein
LKWISIAEKKDKKAHWVTKINKNRDTHKCRTKWYVQGAEGVVKTTT